MPTDVGQKAARVAVMRATAQRKMSATDLAREAGAHPQTVNSFLNGDRWPARQTLAKLDAALGWPAGTLVSMAEGLAYEPDEVERALAVTPGTLGGTGEDAHGESGPTLRDASDEELLAELGYRIVQLRRDAEAASKSEAPDEPVSMQGQRRRRMLEDAQLVDRAASTGPNEGRALRDHLDELAEAGQSDPDGPEFGA